jgi:hypothetical protein
MEVAMRRILASLILTLPLLAACDPKPAGVNPDQLGDAIGRAVGEPATCVLIVERPSGKLLYRYGGHINCTRALPSCDGTATINVEQLAQLAAKGDERAVSCPSGADEGRDVAWAAGPIEPSPGSRYGNAAYAAMMEGETALPGREIKARLEPALRRGGM